MYTVYLNYFKQSLQLTKLLMVTTICRYLKQQYLCNIEYVYIVCMGAGYVEVRRGIGYHIRTGISTM